MLTALIVIAQERFQDIEFQGTLRGLQAAGFNVVVASKEAGPCVGKYGGKQEANVAMRDVKLSDYDRVAFIGGPGAEAFAADSEALALARAVVAAGKPLGAICIAPLILAAAGVLKGKRATVWDNEGEQQEYLRSCGAMYSGEPVTVDGLIVTGNGPEAADAFGTAFASI